MAETDPKPQSPIPADPPAASSPPPPPSPEPTQYIQGWVDHEVAVIDPVSGAKTIHKVHTPGMVPVPKT